MDILDLVNRRKHPKRAILRESEVVWEAVQVAFGEREVKDMLTYFLEGDDGAADEWLEMAIAGREDGELDSTHVVGPRICVFWGQPFAWAKGGRVASATCPQPNSPTPWCYRLSLRQRNAQRLLHRLRRLPQHRHTTPIHPIPDAAQLMA